MSFLDVVSMAFHNLWSRKLRTFLNILGVVLACVVLAMMMAGTRGVAASFERMINESDEIRRFAIYRSWEREDKAPAEATKVTGEMSDARRARLEDRLNEDWLRQNANLVLLDEENLAKLKTVPHMIRLDPQSQLNGTVSIGDTTQAGSIRIARGDSLSVSKLIAGEYLPQDDHNGVLVGEFLAYQMGFASDEEINSLVGKSVEVSVLIRAQRGSQLRKLMESDLVALTSEGESLTAMKRLVEAVDLTSLSDRDKTLLRSVFFETDRDTKEDGYLKKAFTVRGIVSSAEEGDRSFFDFVGSNSNAAIFMTSQQAMEIETGKESFSSYYGAVATVDEVQHLEALLEQVESMGYRTQSSWVLVDRMNEEVGRARLAIGALSLLILLISAIGISNTMVVSVLERTREFGILKATGAQDRNILQLMLMEGALTGLVGALVAMILSVTLAQLIAVFVRQYISGRISQQFDASVFSFSGFDVLLVVTLAVLVCTVASILPAWRAAKLDPVVAMRGK